MKRSRELRGREKRERDIKRCKESDLGREVKKTNSERRESTKVSTCLHVLPKSSIHISPKVAY